jgi:Z1 domain
MAHAPITMVTPVRNSSTDEDGMQWNPVPGSELAGLLAHKLEGQPIAQAQVGTSARDILGRGVPPGQPGSDTGLVVGYVQSGKTLSFTAVTALARDNNFPLIIVIAGSSAQLSDQSQRRIRRDLGIDTDNRRAWAPYHNPKEQDAAGIEGLLDAWRDPDVPARQRQTVVITVMKQHTHLRNLRNVVRRLPMADVATLVIDDEADQASLNTSAQASRLRRARESTTYARLMELRRALPSHTYLQYTATPQAPLLISLIDSLSPRWVDVLEPGDGYTGGITFFGPVRDRRPNSPPPERPLQHREIVRTIPASDIPSNSNQMTTAPASLRYALQLFMVGVAAAYAKDEVSVGNRSMLVHPSVRTADHLMYLNWINDLFYGWRATFRRGDAEADALAEEFREAYDDLAATVGGEIPNFECVKRRFRQAFNETETKEVNRRAGGGPVIIDWGQRYGWILVGGLAMDRGFTVEGLTLTYMPRGLGGGNADSMQQRARFFGYKYSYLGYCRVYLERDARQGFEDYIEHEEFMRAELIRVRDAHEPLQDWPRRFVLDPSLKPCRDNVLSDPYIRSVASANDWVYPQAFMGRSGAEEFNRGIVNAFVEAHQFHEDVGHPGRTEVQRHLVTDPLPLREVVQGLIADFRIRDPGEADSWTNTLAILGRLLDESEDAQAVVYLMSGGVARQRGISPIGRVKQFFQGAAPVNPPHLRGSIYPGDREIAADGVVTVQVRRLNLTEGPRANLNVIAQDVPFLAVKLPQTGLRPMVVQNQPVPGQQQGAAP